MFLRASPRSSWTFVIAAAALVAALTVGPAPLRAQTFDATHLREPVQLGVTWLVHSGDDPAYAQPDFNDSQWTSFDPHNSLKTIFSSDRPSVVWYRLHVKVAPNQTGLALEEWNLENAFDVYVNGQRLMQVGHVDPYIPYTFNAYLLRRIPDAAIAGGSLVIALRVHISQLDWASGFPGLYVYNLALGQYSALVDQRWITVVGYNALSWFYGISGLGLGIVALALFAVQRRQHEYLWIFLLSLCGFLSMPLDFYQIFHDVPVAWTFLSLPFQIGVYVFLTLIYVAFLRIRFARWIQIYLVAVAAGMILSAIGTAYGIGTVFSVLLTTTPTASLIAGVIPALLIMHFRRGNREAGILLIPALLLAFDTYCNLVIFLSIQIPAFAPTVLRVQNDIFNWTLGPMTLNANDLGKCLFEFSLAVIIVLRATRMTHQQAVLQGEMAAAREVQQVILPEQIETVPGFKVETVYQPAEQVGGDFFQILPAAEGGMLMIIGDVAGKGLPAAMLVSMLIGAIRTSAEYTTDPAELLASLNERLVGRAGGFSTAVAALIDAEGSVALAGAGHLPPYLDGKEVELPSALPLGVRSGARYETVRFHLEPARRLTFYSDGIVEAQSQRGEMFGFERARQYSMQPPAAIVAAAREFGQQDDMTVVSIERAPALVDAPKIVLEPAPAL
jgi:sigma-B regulation protein RsbU (phosphoserine phosphatase)